MSTLDDQASLSHYVYGGSPPFKKRRESLDNPAARSLRECKVQDSTYAFDNGSDHGSVRDFLFRESVLAEE